MQTCDTSILNKRKFIGSDVKESIEKVTAESGILPVGTFQYEIFKYPSDIDIFEVFDGCCTFNASKLKASQQIIDIVNDIVNNENIIFMEFKAGYDLRFKIYTGVFDGSIVDYNAGLIKRDINNLFEANLLTQFERDTLFKLVKEIPIIEDVISLNEALRNFWVIRWSAEEILQGYKILRGNFKLYLDVALTQGSIVKLDTISYIENRYVEVSNFMLISFTDIAGNKIVLSEELGDYAESLLMDVHKYYKTNPYKSIKRLWMYLAFKGKICELNVFKPLFESEIAKYSQILSDIETALLLLSPKVYPLMSQRHGIYDIRLLIDTLNERIAIILENKSYLLSINDDPEITINKLKNLKENLMTIINHATYQWLDKNKIDLFQLI